MAALTRIRRELAHFDEPYYWFVRLLPPFEPTLRDAEPGVALTLSFSLAGAGPLRGFEWRVARGDGGARPLPL